MATWTVVVDPGPELKARHYWIADIIAQSLLTLLRNARSRAKLKKVSFDLTYEYLEHLYLEQDGLCYYSKREMSIEPDVERVTRRSSQMISIDRFQPNLGYVEGNVCLCCCDVNIAKSDLPVEDFINMCKAVALART